MNNIDIKRIIKELKCPKCKSRLSFLMSSGTTLYCNKCDKYYVNNNTVGRETISPYQEKDILY